MRRLQFPVTKDHIASSRQANSSHCAIATALKEAYPNLKFVSVDLQTIRATDGERGERYVWFTPRPCQRLIIDFDQGKEVNPIDAVRLQYGQVIQSGRPETKKRRGRKHARRELKRVGNALPIVRGGATPPISRARREFGIRALG